MGLAGPRASRGVQRTCSALEGGEGVDLSGWEPVWSPFSYQLQFLGARAWVSVSVQPITPWSARSWPAGSGLDLMVPVSEEGLSETPPATPSCPHRQPPPAWLSARAGARLVPLPGALQQRARRLGNPWASGESGVGRGPALEPAPGLGKSVPWGKARREGT